MTITVRRIEELMDEVKLRHTGKFPFGKRLSVRMQIVATNAFLLSLPIFVSCPFKVSFPVGPLVVQS